MFSHAFARHNAMPDQPSEILGLGVLDVALDPLDHDLAPGAVVLGDAPTELQAADVGVVVLDDLHERQHRLEHRPPQEVVHGERVALLGQGGESGDHLRRGRHALQHLEHHTVRRERGQEVRMHDEVLGDVHERALGADEVVQAHLGHRAEQHPSTTSADDASAAPRNSSS
jgi:hypothetical protein